VACARVALAFNSVYTDEISRCSERTEATNALGHSPIALLPRWAFCLASGGCYTDQAARNTEVDMGYSSYGYGHKKRRNKKRRHHHSSSSSSSSNSKSSRSKSSKSKHY
jgi:hypothetical protein